MEGPRCPRVAPIPNLHRQCFQRVFRTSHLLGKEGNFLPRELRGLGLEKGTLVQSVGLLVRSETKDDSDQIIIRVLNFLAKRRYNQSSDLTATGSISRVCFDPRGMTPGHR